MQSMEDRIKYMMGDLLLSYARSQQQVEELQEQLRQQESGDDNAD